MVLIAISAQSGANSAAARSNAEFKELCLKLPERPIRFVMVASTSRSETPSQGATPLTCSAAKQLPVPKRYLPTASRAVYQISQAHLTAATMGQERGRVHSR